MHCNHEFDICIKNKNKSMYLYSSLNISYIAMCKQHVMAEKIKRLGKKINWMGLITGWLVTFCCWNNVLAQNLNWFTTVVIQILYGSISKSRRLRINFNFKLREFCQIKTNIGLFRLTKVILWNTNWNCGQRQLNNLIHITIRHNQILVKNKMKLMLRIYHQINWPENYKNLQTFQFNTLENYIAS